MDGDGRGKMCPYLAGISQAEKSGGTGAQADHRDETREN